MHEPYEETEDKYLVEVSALPGCRAWGDSPNEALDHIQSVAAAFIGSYHEHGDELPAGALGELSIASRDDIVEAVQPKPHPSGYRPSPV